MSDHFNNDLLKQFGGVRVNSLNHVLHNEVETRTSENELDTIRHSEYIDIENLRTNCEKNRSNFNVPSMNIQSLSAKFDDLVISLDQLNDDTRNIAVILIQESWLNEDSDLSQLQIEGYSLTTLGRVCSSHSGLGIYRNDNYKYSILLLYNNSTVWEGLFIEVSGKGLKKPVVIGNVYRPPRNNGYQSFINEFTPILSHLDKRYSEINLAGNYNIDLLQNNRKRIVGEFFDLLTSHSFYPQITLPTRLSTMRGTIFDNIFCKLSTTTCQSSASILVSGISDHFLCFISLPHVMPSITRHTIYSADYSPTALAKFKEEINKANLSDLVQPALMSDPSISYSNLDQVLLKAKALHIPPKKVKFDKKKHKKNLWITKGIIKSLTYRNKLYRSFKQCRGGTEVYNTLKTNLHTFDRILKRSILSAKKVYYNNVFNQYKFNIRKTWGAIKDILNTNNNTSA